jgi:hypothetical protein
VHAFAELTRRDRNLLDTMFKFLSPFHHVVSIPVKSHHDLRSHRKGRHYRLTRPGNKGESESEFLALREMRMMERL